MNRIDGLSSMQTLSELMKMATEAGYTERFSITVDGLSTEDNLLHYSPAEVKIINYFRFEGSSNPDDNSILNLLKTEDGRMGTQVDAYGVYANTEITDFFKKVKIEKKD